MKPRIRMLWMQWHAYLSCFFLPVLILYIATGVLYLFDIEGGVKEEFNFSVTLENGWTEQEEDAHQIVSDTLKKLKPTTLPPDYYYYEGDHYWYGFKREVVLFKPNMENNVILTVKEHDLWHQFLLIHKGHAGFFFFLFALWLSATLLFSMGSGVFLALKLPKLKKASLYSIALGILTLTVLVITG